MRWFEMIDRQLFPRSSALDFDITQQLRALAFNLHIILHCTSSMGWR